MAGTRRPNADLLLEVLAGEANGSPPRSRTSRLDADLAVLEAAAPHPRTPTLGQDLVWLLELGPALSANPYGSGRSVEDQRALGLYLLAAGWGTQSQTGPGISWMERHPFGPVLAEPGALPEGGPLRQSTAVVWAMITLGPSDTGSLSLAELTKARSAPPAALVQALKRLAASTRLPSGVPPSASMSRVLSNLPLGPILAEESLWAGPTSLSAPSLSPRSENLWRKALSGSPLTPSQAKSLLNTFAANPSHLRSGSWSPSLTSKLIESAPALAAGVVAQALDSSLTDGAAALNSLLDIPVSLGSIDALSKLLLDHPDSGPWPPTFLPAYVTHCIAAVSSSSTEYNSQSRLARLVCLFFQLLLRQNKLGANDLVAIQSFALEVVSVKEAAALYRQLKAALGDE